MKLSAPTQPVFIISLVLAVIGVLPLLGVAIPIGISAVWALALAYVVLFLGVILKNF
ncbi:MAG: hypothetical protein KDK53_09585 [Maritimibacter sp.]|nr:hypothetical protein [Maritimibacter sp.]